MRVLLNDQATGSLADLIEQVKPARAARVVAPAAANLFRTHLFKLNDERPNRLGGKRTNFFSQAAKATSATAEGGTVKVNVAHVGIRQRVEGGTIRPTNGRKFLTIPARSEAYGTRAKEHPFLVPIFFRSGAGALVEADRSDLGARDEALSGRRRGDEPAAAEFERGGGVWFWLVKSVTQRPDPTVLPDRAAIIGASTQALDAWVALQSKRAAAKAQKGEA